MAGAEQMNGDDERGDSVAASAIEEADAFRQVHTPSPEVLRAAGVKASPIPGHAERVLAEDPIEDRADADKGIDPVRSQVRRVVRDRIAPHVAAVQEKTA